MNDTNRRTHRDKGRLRQAWARVSGIGDDWLLRTIPECALFPSEEVRDRHIAQLDSALEKDNRYWLEVVGLLAIFGGAWYGTASVLAGLPWLPGWGRTAAIVLGVAAFVLIIIAHWRRSVAKRLRDHLIALGIPICKRCGYSLKALTSSRCPECGWMVEDDVLRAVDTDAASAEG